MTTNRRQLWWIVNLISYFVFLGLLVGDILPVPFNLVKMVAVIWTGLITVHSIAMYTGYTGQQPVKEKNKRQFSLGDDGELVEVGDTDNVLGELRSTAPTAQVNVKSKDQ
jgi:hypothetical protein